MTRSKVLTGLQRISGLLRAPRISTPPTPWSTINQSGSNQNTKRAGMGLFAGIASIAAAVGFNQKRDKAPQINTLKQLQAFDNTMLTALQHDLSANDSKLEKKLADLTDGINKAITMGDALAFTHALSELQAIKGSLPVTYLEKLVTRCAVQGRVSLLRILNQLDLEDIVSKNPLAAKLLAHPAADDIERLSSEMVEGIGHIREKGARLQAVQFKEDETRKAEDRVDLPFATGIDCIEDARVTMSFLADQDRARKKVEQQYQNVVILNPNRNDGKELVYYLETLKQIAEKTGAPVDSIFLLHPDTLGGHFTSGQIRIEKKKDGSGRFDVKLFHIDSLGSAEGIFLGSDLIPGFDRVFPEQTQFITSEIAEQKAMKGCSVFSLVHVYDLVHLQDTFKEHEKAGGKQYQDIFDYLAQNGIELHPVGLRGDLKLHEGSDAYYTARPPLLFSRMKQSVQGNKPITYVTYEPLPDKERERCQVDFTYVAKEKRVVGYLGIEGEIKESGEMRRKEQDFVVHAHEQETVNDFLRENITNVVDSKTGKEKLVNNATVYMIGKWSFGIVRWLVGLSPAEILKHTEAFTTHDLAKSHGISAPEGSITEIKEDEDEKKLSL